MGHFRSSKVISILIILKIICFIKKMSIISQFLFSLMVVVTIIYGSQADPKRLLNEMIKNGEGIDGLFKPLEYIDGGGVSHVYKGIRTTDNKTVALKFVNRNQTLDPHREYRMYTYLKAINNSRVERFGIPTVYYYREWNNYILIALTYLNGKDLIDEIEDKHFKNPLDSLMLFRDFVLQSKYVHSCGVRHDDIKPENFMIHKGRCFLFDFDVSAKMNEYKNGTTMEYASRQWHIGGQRTAMDDWESFLYSMCYIHFVKLDWLFRMDLTQLQMSEASKKCAKSKNKIERIIEKIDRYIKSEPLKKVFFAFADEVFYNYENKFPDYDGIYHLICEEIRAMGKSSVSARFTWIDASNDMIPLPNIKKDIKSPKSINCGSFAYPKVVLNRSKV